MSSTLQTSEWIDDAVITRTLEANQTADPVRVREILEKSRELKGISLDDVACLSHLEDPELLEELFQTARDIKDEIYGDRIVLFAPLYISNLCKNECLYCAFRASNKELTRRVLSQEEIAAETEALIRMGHKRLLIVAGESYPKEDGLGYILKSIDTVNNYKASDGGEIRRVNVNLAPLSVEDFRLVKSHGIGTFQIFQETYNRKVYSEVHRGGIKRDFDWRVTAIDRAMEAGIDDVGLGVLFGLADWRYDVLGMMQHVLHLEDRFGVGCHTLSVPRMEPAIGSDIASNPPHPVSDQDFKKIIAVLRLAVPYTGFILSTRENAHMRRDCLDLGISQISGGSRTDPGGYCANTADVSAQFELGDHRELDEVVRELAEDGYLPSFCTACYRTGRTGKEFMDLAKPGHIKHQCSPNALSTFQEYLMDYASPATRTAGEKLIEKKLAELDPFDQKTSRLMLDRVKSGERDIFC